LPTPPKKKLYNRTTNQGAQWSTQKSKLTHKQKLTENDLEKFSLRMLKLEKLKDLLKPTKNLDFFVFLEDLVTGVLKKNCKTNDFVGSK
jgi:hypothetical protein